MSKPIGAFVKTESGWIAEQSIARDLVTLHEISDTICTALNIPLARLKSSRGGWTVSDTRNLYFYYARMLTTETLLTIARYINRDHSTAICGCKRVKDLIETNDSMMMQKIQWVEPLLQRLQNDRFKMQKVVKMNNAGAIVMKLPLSKAK